MSNSPHIDLCSIDEGLGVLAFRGPEARSFLQGQVSANVDRLAVGESTLAGLHNPQGRVIAILVIVRASAEELLAVLPRELVTGVAQRLRKFVFRAKVIVEDVSDRLRVFGSDAGAAEPECIAALVWGMRRLLLVPRAERDVSTSVDAAALAGWLRADIAEGLPQVYSATSESFVAQMLNLDLLGAVAFDKGCYTGQEVIARAHYRGRVKRRLQRWHAAGGSAPRAGDAARTADGRSLTVIRAAAGEQGGWDLLAVGTFAASVAPEDPAGAALVRQTADDPSAVLVEGPLPLPYSLPE
jgi:folate-binding protein YgfZ